MHCRQSLNTLFVHCVINSLLGRKRIVFEGVVILTTHKKLFEKCTFYQLGCGHSLF